ncbi:MULTISPECIES: hypothetical protein [Pseudomonas]|uniref:Uncharacterized protein n=1 Tax=Pseudomonas lutea TaxID=243924 RepID=A0A9X8MH26_9PSED|nr:MULTISPECIES: hypothetical protein [Pseudomonas]SER36374.1 hypothetical protein SAMN05216409_11849 [Pseudomonas lutea]
MMLKVRRYNKPPRPRIPIEQRKKWRKNRRGQLERHCRCCEKWKPVEAFGFIESAGHYRSLCKPCDSQVQKEYRLRKMAAA